MKKSLGARTIAFPAPVFVVGSYDKKGTANAMSVSWGGICCSEPPCMNISLREATYTYGNVMERKAFTISIPSESQVKEADYCGIASGRKEDKFKAAKLTPVKSDLVDAPYVKEFPFVIECALIHSYKIGLHTIFIGQIKDVKADTAFLTEEGMADIEKIKPFSFNPATRTYYKTGAFLAQAFSIGKP